MKDFLLIENDNNLKLIEKDFAFTDSSEVYVQQKIRMRFFFFLGEWYLNVNKGIDYFGKILIKNPNFSEIEAIFKTEIATVDGVEEIIEFNMNYDTSERSLQVDFKVKLESGEVIADSIVTGI